MSTPRYFVATFFLIIAVLTPAHHAIGQFFQGAGVYAGGVASTVDTNYQGLQTDTKYGFSVSGFAEWVDHDIISIVTEAGFVQRGFDEEYRFFDVEAEQIIVAETSTRLGYLSFPVIMKVRPLDSYITPYLLAGIRTEFLVQRQPGSFSVGDEDISSEIAESFESTTMGSTLGIGVSTDHFRRANVYLEIRNDTDFSSSTSNAPVDFYNNAYRFILGFGW